MANFLLLLASRFAAVVKAYFSRVGGDGGTTVNKQHAQEVYTDTNDYNPTLIQSCDSGKATVLYSLLVNPQALLETFTGSAAAYSLRSLSASTTNVVKVRRSSDDTEQDFTAADITDGTLLTFVNENVEKVLNGDFSNGSTNWTISNGSVTGGEYVSGTISAYQSGIKQSPFTFTGTGTLTFDLTLNSGSIRIDDGGAIKLATSSGSQSFTLTNPSKLEFNAYNLGFDGIIDNVSFIPTNVDGFVTTWYDQSGNGYNATQATAANQPKIVSSGSLVTENGKAALDFDPVSLQYLSSTITTPTDNVCFAGVCYTTSLSGNRGFMEIMDASNDGYELRYDPPSANFAINSTDLLVTSSNQFLWFANYDGSTQLNSINGSGDTQSAVESISISTSTLKIGARLPASGNSAYYWDGKIQEAIFYPTDQSANRTGIEANINDYYNIYS